MIAKTPLPWRIRPRSRSAPHFFYLAVAFSIGYAWLLSSLPSEVFLDRQNYLNYVDGAGEILDFRLEGRFFAFLANEPIWLFLNLVLSRFFQNSEDAIRFYVFISAGIFSFFVLRHNPRHFGWLLLFLLSPQIVKNYIVHLRQGVAIALFFVGWKLTTSRWRWSIISLTPFIHASFFFIIALALARNILVNIKISRTTQLIVFFIFSLCLTVSVGLLSAAMGARQAEEYADKSGEFSGLGFIFWFGIFLIFLLQGREYFKRFSLEMLILIFYLTSYFLVPVTARVFESALILILLAGLNLRGWSYWTFVAAIFSYATVSYSMQWNKPWLGFGI